MGSTWLYLIRHGEVVDAASRRFIGHVDVPLSTRGEAQCESLARELAGERFAAVYSSDLARARRSAEILSAPHGLSPVSIPALREMAMGRWEGLTADEIQAREPEAFSDWMSRIGEFPFPDGESLLDLERRAMPALTDLLERHRGRSLLVVAHGGTNRVILCRALGIPLEKIVTLGQDYAGLSVLEWKDGECVLHLLNQRSDHA